MGLLGSLNLLNANDIDIAVLKDRLSLGLGIWIFMKVTLAYLLLLVLIVLSFFYNNIVAELYYFNFLMVVF